ncbi:hypothetical protein L226DRAFT_472627, partial [Lentinus tigrinus ALCF2SS1-7]|uniref:uncharacterized protein n=1 Tax=Lentinus tigrinus ALCF2SS1-7 TaxID=1328758 RepID=UPI001165CB66
MCFCISSHDSSDAHDNLSAALALLAAGQQVLAAVPIPGFPVVAGVLSEVIVRVQKTRTNHAALLTLSNRITNLVDAIMDAGEQIHLRINAFDNNDPRRLSLCKRLNQVSTHPEPIGQLLTELNALRDKANTLYQGPCLFRCLYSERDAQTIQSLQTGFDGALQLFQVRSPLRTMQWCVLMKPYKTRCAMLIMKDLEALIATTCVEQGQASLNNLVHADPAFRTDLHKEYSALLHGTRSALLADLEDWATATTPDTKPICILTGCAGTGKTAIAMEIAHRFHQQRRLGAAFAFLHTDGRDCGSAFFSSLAYELAENQETLRPHIVDAAIRLSGRRCRTKETARRLIEDPFRAAQGHQSPILLIIDDLDRYAANTSHHAPDILEVLMSCVKNSSFPLRTLLISRPEHSFEAVLDEYSTDVRRISLEDIPREVVDEDIEQFLRKSLSRTLPGRALLQDVPNGLSRVVQQAEGWFSHARAALNYLNADPEHMFSQLDVLLSNGPSRSGSVPLRDLDRMYAAVLTAAFPPTQMELLPEKQNRLQHVLGYVALLMTPISPGDLESLSLIPCTDSLPILNGLRSLVPIQRDGRDDKIRLLHSSFRGFLLDPKRCTNPLYSVDVSACHADLAECCLSTLTLLRPNVCRLREPNVPKAEWVGIAQRVKDYIPDHVQYACLHWADHLSGASGNERLISRLAVFSRESMKTWLEALGYMGQLDVAERALAAAHGWLDSERFADIRALLHEARLLVVAHRTEVDVCPYRIY